MKLYVDYADDPPEPAERPDYWRHTFGASWDRPRGAPPDGREWAKRVNKTRRASDLKKHHVKVQRAVAKAKAAGRPKPTPPKRREVR